MATAIFDQEGRPRIKPTIQRNQISGKIYLRTSGQVTEMEEASLYSRVLGLCDGRNTISDICTKLRDGGVQATVDEILSTIAELDEHLLLEDAVKVPVNLNEYELERWNRNINFFGSFCRLSENKYAVQEKIKRTKVTLLGLGGLGSHLLYDMAAMGITDILAVEFDKVEISNLNRQILYDFEDAGRRKVEVARERIAGFSPTLKFVAYEKRIESPDDVVAAVSGRDVVICVADRPKMEILHWVNAACVQENVPLVTGGLDTQVARYYSVIPYQSGCLECWRRGLKDGDALSDSLLTEQRRTQMRGDNAAFVVFVAVLAGLMLSELVKIVTGIGGPPRALNMTREIDFTTMEISVGERWAPDVDCACCGRRAVHRVAV